MATLRTTRFNQKKITFWKSAFGVFRTSEQRAIISLY